MKKILSRTAILCLCLLNARPLSSQEDFSRFSFTTGNDVLSVCTDGSAFSRHMCTSYMDGVIAGYRLSSDAAPSFAPDFRLCFPQGVKKGEIYDLVLKDLKDHPEARHERSEVLIINSLLAPWHCQK